MGHAPRGRRDLKETLAFTLRPLEVLPQCPHASRIRELLEPFLPNGWSVLGQNQRRLEEILRSSSSLRQSFDFWLFAFCPLWKMISKGFR